MATAAVKQANRVLQLETPLGADVLVVNGMAGSQEVSGLFRYHLDLLAEVGQNISFKKLLGQSVAVKFEGGGEINGIVNRISVGGRTSRFIHYYGEIVPWTYLLTL